MFDRINIAINGQQANLSKDSIIYNGSIYVPLRSLSEMLGAEVSWDDDTRSVNLDFIADYGHGTAQGAAEKGMYQYIAIQNNGIMADMIQAMKQNDAEKMKEIRDRYGELEKLSSDIQDAALSTSYGKLKAAVELLRTGWISKNFDEYSIAWSIYNTNAEKVNTTLKAKLAQ
jgi:uncharacterized protein YukE